MKNLKKYLPILILILVLAVLFSPAKTGEVGGSAGGGSTLSAADQAGTADASEQPSSSGALQLLEASSKKDSKDSSATGTSDASLLDEHGSYTSKEDVLQYLLQYGHLPENFVTKAEAQKAGWVGGGLEQVLPGKCIGGDRFGNREGQLPKAKGRTWTECDINTLGKRSRGAERLVFSNDGLFYYTADHYENFTLLYGKP